MTLIFVRHGQSKGNELGIAQGWTDYGLTERGRSDARAAAARLAELAGAAGYGALYSSDLGRALETAEIIGARLGIAVQPDEALREQRFGEGEGLTWRQVQERWGADVRPGRGHVPGEERTADFRARVVARFELLMERHRQEVAICASHGGAIRAAIAHTLGLTADQHPRVQIDNASLTVFELDRGRPLIATLNDGCHVRSAAERAG